MLDVTATGAVMVAGVALVLFALGGALRGARKRPSEAGPASSSQTGHRIPRPHLLRDGAGGGSRKTGDRAEAHVQRPGCL